jgi:hypothetical protein
MEGETVEKEKSVTLTLTEDELDAVATALHSKVLDLKGHLVYPEKHPLYRLTPYYELMYLIRRDLEQKEALHNRLMDELVKLVHDGEEPEIDSF